MNSHDQLSRSDAPAERLRIVDLSEYCELLVSRRQLERDERDRGRLRDRRSNELYVLQMPSIVRVPQFA